MFKRNNLFRKYGDEIMNNEEYTKLHISVLTGRPVVQRHIVLDRDSHIDYINSLIPYGRRRFEFAESTNMR